MCLEVQMLINTFMFSLECGLCKNTSPIKKFRPAWTNSCRESNSLIFLRYFFFWLVNDNSLDLMLINLCSLFSLAWHIHCTIIQSPCPHSPHPRAQTIQN